MFDSLIFIVTSYQIVTVYLSTSSGEPAPDILTDYISMGDGAYKIHTDKVTWNDARKICANETAQLVIMNSAAEESMLKKLMLEKNVDMIWLGVHNLFKNEDWVTINGRNLEYTNWAPEQPNHIDYEHCAVLYFVQVWHDYPCESTMAFICEKIFVPQSLY